MEKRVDLPDNRAVIENGGTYSIVTPESSAEMTFDSFWHMIGEYAPQLMRGELYAGMEFQDDAWSQTEENTTLNE
jgi:hypothetical protein